MNNNPLMNINPVNYSQLNDFHMKDATEQIDKIVQAGLPKAPIILDVGCGSGNVSQALVRQIPVEHFLACDINGKMVEFAKAGCYKTCKNTNFFVCDITKGWKELNPILTAVEGKVDLVFSNYVIHWLPYDLRTPALQNMVRLLKPGGHLYISVVFGKDVISCFPERSREKLEKLISIPSFAAQTELWRSYLTSLELHSFSLDYKVKPCEMNDEMRRQLRQMFNYYKPFFNAGAADAEITSFLDDVSPRFCKTFDISEGEGRCPTISNEILHIHGIK